MISQSTIEILRKGLQFALENGAGQCRVALCESVTDVIDTLNAEVDKVTHCFDSAFQLSIYIDGRYGEFTTNTLSGLEDFILKSIDLTKLMTPDPCRTLPAYKNVCKNATTGNELGKWDPSYANIDPSERTTLALQAALFGKINPDGAEIISEEGQYADGETDSVMIDSNGAFCAERQTSFSYSSEITVLAPSGERYSGYWWDSSAIKDGYDIMSVGKVALAKAMAQIGAEPAPSGKYNMVVDQSCASRLVNPLLDALCGYNLQQDNSFLKDTLGKKVFNGGFTLLDDCHRAGERGSTLFDSEGVATKSEPVVQGGEVKKYFLSTYFAAKMDMAQTQEECVRPHVLPYPCELSKEEILKKVGNGILVTGFNGGNSNSSTGDFSYGVEGLLFENGQIVKPVGGMLITGNFIDLFNHLRYAGADVRFNMTNLIPSLAFSSVDFSG